MFYWILPIVLIFVLLLFLSLQKKDVTMDDENLKVLGFQDLSDEVQDAFLTKLENPNIYPIIINLDKDFITLKHKKSRFGPWVGDDVFLIQSRRFVLNYKKGNPFVLYKKKFYYTKEYNLRVYNYRIADYVEIDLSKYLDYM